MHSNTFQCPSNKTNYLVKVSRIGISDVCITENETDKTGKTGLKKFFFCLWNSNVWPSQSHQCRCQLPEAKLQCVG